MQKEQLRTHYITQRDALAHSERIAIDNEILQQLLQFPAYLAATNISCFLGFGTEINTVPFIASAMQTGRKIYLPRVQKNRAMTMHVFTKWENLEKSTYGIFEPTAHTPIIPPSELDIIIIPCLACTQNGYRLGYGGGYYDKYLSTVGNVPKVIICRDAFVVDTLPIDLHDIAADYIITEKRIIKVK